MSNLQITSIAGRHKASKRVGRGSGSGHGKTSGRGHKGGLSRSGSTLRLLYEGGQMPLFRRIPKRGFSNYKFAQRYEIVNVSQLERFFDDDISVGVEQLSNAGLIDNLKSKVKILGDGQLTKKLQVTAHKFSKSAEQKIVASGGSVNLVEISNPKHRT
jgi:large subunit ribosomal protein L15